MKYIRQKVEEFGPLIYVLSKYQNVIWVLHTKTQVLHMYMY